MAIEILFYDSTPLGMLCLRRRELLSNPGAIITEVTLDHEFLMSSHLTSSERELAKRGLERVRGDRSGGNQSGAEQRLEVLVGGLGLGYTAAEALDSDRVASVEVVEFLPQVIGWLNDDLIPLADQLKADQRLLIAEGDIYARLTGPVIRLFDLVVIDVDHSPQDILGDQSQEFYTAAGLRCARTHLKPGGVIGIWSYAPDSPLLERLNEVFDEVHVEQVTVWNDLIREEQTDWLFFASRSP